MAAKTLIQGSIIRATYGILALLLPRLLVKSVGMNPNDIDPDARYFNRLFGGRDILVAGATVAAVKAGAERQATKANMVCEFTDSISLLEELRSGRSFDRTIAIAIAFNVTGYLTWLKALRALRAGSSDAAS
jgi:hypothetical protein